MALEHQAIEPRLPKHDAAMSSLVAATLATAMGHVPLIASCVHALRLEGDLRANTCASDGRSGLASRRSTRVMASSAIASAKFIAQVVLPSAGPALVTAITRGLELVISR